MVTNFSELHEDGHDAEEVAVGKGVFCFVGVDVFIVKESLTAGEVALDDMFDFLRKLLFNILFHSSKQKWS